MKSFWFSIILLIAALLGVGINCTYIHRVSNELYTRLDGIPSVYDPTCAAACEELQIFWDQEVDLVSLSVGYSTVDRVSEQIVTLASCANCEDLYGFQTALALLRDAVGDMHRLEHLSLGNLF